MLKQPRGCGPPKHSPPLSNVGCVFLSQPLELELRVPDHMLLTPKSSGEKEEVWMISHRSISQPSKEMKEFLWHL